MAEDLEEPEFKLICEYKTFEVRQYMDTVQARVASYNDKNEKSRIHFRKIASYIFGNNDKIEEISMTAPVHMWKVDNKDFMAFTMPSKYNLKELPKPNDEEIQLLNVKSDIVAVLKFSWFAGQTKTSKLIKELQNMIETEGLKRKGTPKLAVYDNPMTTLPFMRRNEIHLPIEWPINRQ